MKDGSSHSSTLGLSEAAGLERDFFEIEVRKIAAGSSGAGALSFFRDRPNLRIAEIEPGMSRTA